MPWVDGAGGGIGQVKTAEARFATIQFEDRFSQFIAKGAKSRSLSELGNVEGSEHRLTCITDGKTNRRVYLM